MVLREGKHNKRIDVVFNIYKENSIKNSERLLQGWETGHQFQNTASIYTDHKAMEEFFVKNH